MLTDIECKNATPRDKAYKLADHAGLYLYVTKAGARSWRYNYRINGQFKTFTYGLYPELSLQDARAEHSEAHKLVSKGIDPNDAQKQEQLKYHKNKACTFKIMADEWLTKRKGEVKPKTLRDIESRLEKDVMPFIGHIPMKELAPLDILDMLRKIEKRGAIEMAKRARISCSQILKYATASGKIERDFTLDITDALVTRPVKHQPALKPNDIPLFLNALERNEARLFLQTRLALKMLLLTFVRPFELASAEWTEFDFEDKRWIVPASKTKMGKDLIVPLATQTIEILDQLREMNGHRQYILVNQRDPRKHMNRDSLSNGVRKLGFGGKHTAHGFRALAMTSLLEKLKYPFDVIDCQLGHGKKNSLGAAYDRAQFLDERIPMMQAWADYIDTLASGTK